MKNYKEYETVELGSSKSMTLIIRNEYDISLLDFDNVGPYKAYIVDEEAIIADHYWRVKAISRPYYSYIRIYDDEKCTYVSPMCRAIDIYRAGRGECLIQLRGERKV